MVIPCLYLLLLTVLRTPSAELPINKKRTLIENRVRTTLVDIPTRVQEPRAKQQPNGLIAYSADWRRQSRPVRVLYRPALT